jgi:two-component system chemotaxis response regulator CheB
MLPAASPRAVRILIVDDSAVMRALLRSVVTSDPRIEVAGTASDGASALRSLDSARPDLILLDVEMPGMDGLSTLKQMKAAGKHIPVIMCSSLTQRGAKVTMDALASGAADYVAKPSGQRSREVAIQTLAQDLIPKILALTGPAPGLAHSSGLPHSQAAAMDSASAFGARFGGPLSSGRPVLPQAFPNLKPIRGAQAAAEAATPPPAIAAPPSIVVIGVSTGGPAALDTLLPELPADFPLPVLIVQHMPELFTSLLAERLNGRCPLRVSEATPGEPVRRGSIYIARGDWHLEVVLVGSYGSASSSLSSTVAPAATLRLTQEPHENHCRPAVDVLFRTAVSVYGSRVLGIVLTGMGYDGLAGSRLIRQRGGTVLAQDQSTSAVWGMPGAVAQAGLAQRILPLNAIAPEILRLAGRSQREAHELRESTV